MYPATILETATIMFQDTFTYGKYGISNNSVTGKKPPSQQWIPPPP